MLLLLPLPLLIIFLSSSPSSVLPLLFLRLSVCVCVGVAAVAGVAATGLNSFAAPEEGVTGRSRWGGPPLTVRRRSRGARGGDPDRRIGPAARAGGGYLHASARDWVAVGTG